jgi:hypothetical protein
MAMNRRAMTPEQKRAVVERLLTAWSKYPELRLGQLIDCALGDRTLFHVEDLGIAELVEQFVRKLTGK